MKHTKHLIEAFFVKIIFLLFKLLPISISSEIGARLARNIGPYLAVSNIARTNIRNALKEESAENIEKIVKLMWDNLGRVVAEFPHIYSLTDQQFEKRVKIEGIENLKEFEQPKAAIFFSAHIANWEVSPRVLINNGINLSLVYRSANNKFVDKIINQERSKHNINIIPKGAKAARKILATLNAKNALAMLVDQKMNDGINVPFFAMQAMTAPAIARMALNFDCPIIPVQVIRIKGANFIVKINKPLEITKTSDNDKDIYNIMLEINKIIEGWIRENPAQWFWLHKRWKK